MEVLPTPMATERRKSGGRAGQPKGRGAPRGARSRPAKGSGSRPGRRGAARGRGGLSPLIPIAVIIAVLLVGHFVSDALTTVREPQNILLLGVDADRTRTDVIVLAHIDPEAKAVTLLSIPRDTLVEIPCAKLVERCRTPDKLAHAHAYGSKRGPEVTAEVVESLLGVEIDGYVKVDFAGFEQAVDILGGVPVVIEEPMHYEDPTADPPLQIHFEPGRYTLSGADALRYVRYRADGRGDIGRTERTRKFLLNLLQTLRERWSPEHAAELVAALLPHVQTDLRAGKLAALARMAFELDLSRVRTAMLPGEPLLHPSRGWVWEVDRETARQWTDTLLTP